MAIVITVDQRASRHEADHVARAAKRLNRSLVDDLTLPFVRTAGDEMQGVVATGEGLAIASVRCLEEGWWWIGVGIGPIDQPLGATARETRGPAFWSAREAVARAHKQKGGSPGPIAVVGEPRAIAENLEAALGAIAFIIAKRTARQRDAVGLARQRSGLRWVADRLDVTVSAVSQMLRTAGLEEQLRLEMLVARLAAEVA